MGLLDDVVKGINEGITTIQTKSQEIVHTVSLNNRLVALEARKNAAFSNIGRLIYDKYAKDDEVGDDLLRFKVREIQDLEAEIAQLKAEIDSIKASSDTDIPHSERANHKAGYTPTPGFTCPNCNAPANKDKKFCAICGGSLDAAPKTETKNEAAQENSQEKSNDSSELPPQDEPSQES